MDASALIRIPMEVNGTQFGVELLRLARRCRGFDKHISASVGLSVDEMHCLGVLFSEKPSSVKTLSDMINVSPTRASKILKHLEQKGFVLRTPDLSDHRREQVMLTDRGKEAVQKVLALCNEIGSRLLRSGPSEVGSDFSWLLRSATHSD